jgi:hypothetical protein
MMMDDLNGWFSFFFSNSSSACAASRITTPRLSSFSQKINDCGFPHITASSSSAYSFRPFLGPLASMLSPRKVCFDDFPLFPGSQSPMHVR